MTKKSEETRLAAAHARIMKDEGRVSVRALRREARCSTDAAAEFLRQVGGASEAPPVPAAELEASLSGLWAVAWKYASRAAYSEIEEERQARIKNEAEALSDVEYAQNEADEALSKLASATSDAEKREADLTRRIKELETSLQAAKDALRIAGEETMQARAAAARAEGQRDEARRALKESSAPRRNAKKNP